MQQRPWNVVFVLRGGRWRFEYGYGETRNVLRREGREREQNNARAFSLGRVCARMPPEVVMKQKGREGEDGR